MARKMRRSRQELPKEEAYKLLKDNVEGVLSLIDADGLPYGIPINYAVIDNALYMHGAIEGRKFDAIQKNGIASMCVIASSEMYPEKFTTKYKSVIVEGPITIVEDVQEKRAGLIALAELAGQSESASVEEVDKFLDRCAVMRLDIDEISGKQAKELVEE